MTARLGGVPLDLLLTAIRGPVRLEVEESAGADVQSASFRIDEGPWADLQRLGHLWRAELSTQTLADGVHQLEVLLVRRGGFEETLRGSFRARNRAR